jgi:phospholipid/cholesterol/gamma-HCH transport system ATP-binding protein
MGDVFLRNICLNLGGTAIFDNLTELFPAGQVYLLIGPSGGGKTSLLKVISGLWPADSGVIQFDGDDILKFNKAKMLELHKRSGFVFQSAALISNMSVFDNLALFYQYHTDMDNSEIMERLNLYLNMLGCDFDLDQRPNSLSTGQRILVSIVRAISHNPDYIFLDEPVANLDAVSTRRVRDIILDLKKRGKTMVMVTHNLNFGFAVADKIGVLANGKIVESGTKAEITNSSNEITKTIFANDY